MLLKNIHSQRVEILTKEEEIAIKGGNTAIIIEDMTIEHIIIEDMTID